jgi:hypothetical protein
MPEKPFRERGQAQPRRGPARESDKDDFEEKVRADFDRVIKLFDDFKQGRDKGKPEKDEKAEIEKTNKDRLDIKAHKHEKLEKERKDIVKEGEVLTAADVEIGRRLDALEAVVGKLVHFIPAEMRPDLSKAALTQEPGRPAETKTARRKR